MDMHRLFKMPPSSLLLLFSTVFSPAPAHALPWIGARPTSTYTADEWTPRPTISPRYTIDILGQDAGPASICGWISGDLARPAVCGTGSSCIHDTVHGVVGCCSIGGSCTAGIYTSCIDSSQGDRGFGLQNGVLSCPGTSVCNRNTYPSGYYQYECGESTTVESIATTFSGQPSDFQLQVLSTAIVLSQDIISTLDLGTTSLLVTQTTASPTSTFSTGQSSSTTLSTASSPSSTTSQSPNPNSLSPEAPGATTLAPSIPQDDSGSSISRSGAIIGGTLGGAFGLAGILFALLFCRRRRQQKKQAEEFHAGHLMRQHDLNTDSFQNLTHTHFSPDDFGHRSEDSVALEAAMMQQYAQTQTHHPPHPAVFPIAYRNPPSYPSSQSHSPSPPPIQEQTQTQTQAQVHAQAQPQESTPLVSEIEDFSRSWAQHTQSIPRKPHPAHAPPPLAPLSAPVPIPATIPEEEPHQVWEVVNLRGGSLEQERTRSRSRSHSHSHSHSQPRNQNKTQHVRSPTFDMGIREEGWRPDPLSPVSALTPPPKNPRRLEMAQREEDVRRYQLVDRAPRGDNVPVLDRRGENVPILQSPSTLMRQRRL